VFFVVSWGCPFHEEHEEPTKGTKKMKQWTIEDKNDDLKEEVLS
jgi:hypothetical protein